MKNDINKFYDCTPLISFERLVELMCLCYSNVDSNNISRVPMNICDLLVDFIKTNDDGLNDLVNILDIVMFDENEACFRGWLNSGLNSYINKQNYSIDYTNKDICIKYDRDPICIALSTFEPEIMIRGLTLVDLLKEYRSSLNKVEDTFVRSKNKK